VTLDRLPELDALSPDEGEVIDAELAVTDDVLVKAFALGPGAELSPHEHADSTNVFHVVAGEVTVQQGEGGEATAEPIAAPGVVLNERGTVHGARNEGDERALLTASLCPLPS